MMEPNEGEGRPWKVRQKKGEAVQKRDKLDRKWLTVGEFLLYSKDMMNGEWAGTRWTRSSDFPSHLSALGEDAK